MNTSNLEIRHIVDNGQSPLAPRIETSHQLSEAPSSRALTAQTAVIAGVSYKLANESVGAWISDIGHRTGDTSIQENIAFLGTGLKALGALKFGGVIGLGIYAASEGIKMTAETVKTNRERQRHMRDMEDRLGRVGGLASHYSRIGGSKI